VTLPPRIIVVVMAVPPGGDRILPSLVDIFAQEFLSEGCLSFYAGRRKNIVLRN